MILVQLQPTKFQGKIKSGLRNRTNSKGAEKCSTFNENIIEALYDIQVNFIDMESDVYLANEIRRLYQVIFSEDIDAESLLTPKSVDTFVLQIKKANCMVLPSYREGMPKFLLEAGAMEIPSITTDVPGCRNIIKHNFN